MNRVLIIEDDAVTRRQLAQLFRFEDFDVAEAESGAAGIAAALSAAPDLVICDIMMPGMDGFGVLESLRGNHHTALTPFIFLTAKAGGKDVRQGMSEGADDYITKPFDPEALLASARQRLARRRMQIQEAERRASDTGMLAAAALPREMEGCLAHLETLSDALAAKFEGDRTAQEMGEAIKADLGRLRILSQRLRLYGDLPNLYARRFVASGGAAARSSVAILAARARETAGHWGRSSDIHVSAVDGAIPLPDDCLSAVVGELVDNACKFSPAATPITIEARLETAYWDLVVADRGCGMLARQIQEIGAFKQFWSGAERPRGLGIGLVLVETLVRLQGGEVHIESEPGAGTRVDVMVPLE
jgi:two-component system, sensor histidine kinase and response regulator